MFEICRSTVSGLTTSSARFRGPGAGKSRAARALARLYKDLGLLTYGHLIEITGVDDARNDPAVEVSIYKGMDRLVRTGDNGFVPFLSQRIDPRFHRKRFAAGIETAHKHTQRRA